MAENNQYGHHVNQLGIEQILAEAKNRWLRPAEICEILKNYKNYVITQQPAVKPPSGSLFLFNRKVLRYFRKDGHNWRKKKDGKTVKEAHERLKSGSIDVLHCYYAHGEENKNFQRRSYWMLEEELSHIVLVHYHEVKGNKTGPSHTRDSEEATPYSRETSELETSISSSFHSNTYQFPSHTPDTTSLSSVQASEYEDAESAYNHHTSSGGQHTPTEKIDPGLSAPYYPLSFSNDHQGDLSAIPGMGCISHTQEMRNGDGSAPRFTHDLQKQLDFVQCEDAFEHDATAAHSGPFQTSRGLTGTDSGGIITQPEHRVFGHILREEPGRKQEPGYLLQGQDQWQSSEGFSSHISKLPMYEELPSDSLYDIGKRISAPEDSNLQLSFAQREYFLELDSESALAMEGKSNYSSILKQSLLDGSLPEEGLKKLDSFNRWADKELGDVSDILHPSSLGGAYWDIDGRENSVNDSSAPFQSLLDTDMMCSSICQDQLFSIIDFTPSWAYAGSEIMVTVTGRFLISQQSAITWSCMFGEVEVPADSVAEGVLLCQAPPHKPGRVPFYVSCSNRLACSEVREFEYRPNHIEDEDTVDDDGRNISDIPLHVRFEKLLSLGPECPSNHVSTSIVGENLTLSNKFSQLMKEFPTEWISFLNLTLEKDCSLEEVKDQQFQQLLNEKLHVWLLQKESEGGKGPNVLDEGGQGVLHFTAALGYDWAIQPTVAAGVNVNYRDVNGWTALHWAALCGRERTVASLISLGAAPGALTDPTPVHPSGLTPADLAYASSHKGIAGYLAESSLSAHLSSLELKDTAKNKLIDVSGAKAVQAVTDRSPTPSSEGDLPYVSLKDSLAAVCNATQAASRIHQVYRVQSFQKKQLNAQGDDTIGGSNERALSLIALKSHKHGHHNEPVHAAATRIQNKFRSWKGRKDFLIIRQRIVKIQAHVRGHQVRRSYGKILWSVGVLEKVILRWRRKGSGLRGFKPETVIEGPSSHDRSLKEDVDFLKEGRKQTEERLQKALARVKSMVQYPEARDQYRRLLNVVSEIQETKVVCDTPLNSYDGTNDFDDLIDIEALLDDNTMFA